MRDLDEGDEGKGEEAWKGRREILCCSEDFVLLDLRLEILGGGDMIALSYMGRTVDNRFWR